jgi:hypothetical protein
MDDLDTGLIAELRRDGRASISELAERLRVSRATVRTRLERLKEAGEIAGFIALTRADISEAPVRGLMMIGIEGRGGAFDQWQMGSDRRTGDGIAGRTGRGDPPHPQYGGGDDLGNQPASVDAPRDQPQDGAVTGFSSIGAQLILPQ